MDRLDFYKLSRPVQDRFIGSANGNGFPTPILEQREGTREPPIWLAASGVAIIALIVIYRMHLGDLESRISIHGWLAALVYWLLVSAAFFGLLRALGLWAVERALPFRPGVYVFPIGVIDARKSDLFVYR